MSLFEDKTPMPGNAHIKRAGSGQDMPIPQSPRVEPSDTPVRVSQTLEERYTDQADDAMSVANLMRPRRGHGY
jgi:hypothetical protein